MELTEERAAMRLERAAMRLAQQTAESESAAMTVAQKTAESECAAMTVAQVAMRLELQQHLDTQVQSRRRLFELPVGDADPQPLQPEVPIPAVTGSGHWKRSLEAVTSGRKKYHDRRTHLMRPPSSGQFPRLARTSSPRTAFAVDSIAQRNLRVICSWPCCHFTHMRTWPKLQTGVGAKGKCLFPSM